MQFFKQAGQARALDNRPAQAGGRRPRRKLLIAAALVLAVVAPAVAALAPLGAQGTDVCRPGLIVGSGESCTYPGASVEFSVDSSGRGSFLFSTSRSSINITDATINGVVYNFVAQAQSDGSWLIEAAGDSVDPTPTPNPNLTPTPTATPNPNPTVTPTPNPNLTPTPTPTANPNPTATPTPNPNPTATPTPTASGICGRTTEVRVELLRSPKGTSTG